MHNVYLFQPQYKMEVDKSEQYWIPYSVGCLWSYAQQHAWVKENFILKNLYFQRENIQTIVDQLENPSVCGFSCYVWNEQYCLMLAEKIKARWPKCHIVFGGPQVNTSTVDKKFIDVVILNEGEQAFVKILQAVLNKFPPDEIYFGERLLDLNIPSPYITGVFDDIIRQYPNAKWHATLETNRGCPYQCTFCDWGSLTYSKIKTFDLNRVEADIKWMSTNPVTYIYCADANFGILKERDLTIAKLFRQHLYDSQVEAINLQFAKNSNETVMQIAKIIGRLNRGVTVSVQSLNDITLDAIKRKNLKINDLQEIFKLANENNVKTYSEFILGLPEETLDSWKAGLTDIIEHGQHQSIDVWFCHLLKNSELASQPSKLTYGIQTISVKDYLALHNNNDSIPEYLEVISSTNTMTLDDIVEGYMYGWMIIQFHINGYTQVLAKSARVNNISYRKFYDCLFDKIANSKLKDHANELKIGIENYLKTGSSPFKNSHSTIYSYSSDFFYNNRNTIFELGNTVFTDLTNSVDSNYFDLQTAFIYDNNKTYPYTIQLGDVKYSIESQIKQPFNFYNNRRKSLLKNIIKIID
jgi:radical SAM superfamily enzyme